MVPGAEVRRIKKALPLASAGNLSAHPSPNERPSGRRGRPNYRGSGEDRAPRRFELRDRPDITGGHVRPSQRPFGVAQEIRKIMEEGSLDDAIKMVSSAPISSQNEVVWTLLIKQALKEERTTLAFDTYNQMKKRGFMPTGRNYTAILSGYDHLSQLNPKQWERVNRIWEHYKAYLTACRGRDGVEGSEVLSPHVPYFKMLARLGEYDRMVSIFESMDTTGPLAPNKFLCTAILGLVARRPGSNTERGDVRADMASMTVKIANYMMEAKMIDNFALCTILRGLVKGGDEHLRVAWDILSKQIGDITDPSVLTDSAIEVDHFLFDVILELCCAMNKYHLAIDLVDRAIQSKNMKQIVTRNHVHYALDALSYQAAEANEQSKPPSVKLPTTPASSPSAASTSPSPLSPSAPLGLNALSAKALSLLEFTILEAYSGHPKDVLPTRSTYHRALVIAWRANDWETATRVFQIMTGLDPAHFTDAGSFQGPPKSLKSIEAVVDMDAQSMSYLVRIACARDDVGMIKIALRIHSYYGPKKMFGDGSNGGGRDGMDAFYRYKHAVAVREAVIRVMQESLTQAERVSYKQMLFTVKREKERLQQGRDFLEQTEA
ncbi:hypothetical protein FRB96_008723 [Tulasnella sp. 330]|nr:hypothetical protein FRB96_008723 [Tulasnella sp. 330]